ncbi:hypothetical protein IFM89_027753 [Coptis chinensis]|uniref:U-box domain-containing protein n=1 Tax=Coptis chinensis TaxID=261450 RepID=A0A835HXQ0_9MAGN|nr:hypothetical protein IFM89_027753 [Coptis chinensis]
MALAPGEEEEDANHSLYIPPEVCQKILAHGPFQLLQKSKLVSNDWESLGYESSFITDFVLKNKAFLGYVIQTQHFAEPYTSFLSNIAHIPPIPTPNLDFCPNGVRIMASSSEGRKERSIVVVRRLRCDRGQLPNFYERRETREYVESEEEVELEGASTWQKKVPRVGKSTVALEGVSIRQKKVPPMGKSTVALEGVSTWQKKVPPVGKSTPNKGVGVTQNRKRRATEEGSSKSVKEGNHTEAPLKKKACLVTGGRELRRSTRLMGSDDVVLLQPATDKDVDMSVGQNDVGLVEPDTSSDEGDDTSFAQDKVVGFEPGTATEPELATMSYAEDNAVEVEADKAIDTDEVDSEETKSVNEIEFDVGKKKGRKKKVALQASAQTASAKKACLATGKKKVIATSGREAIEGDQDPLKKKPTSGRKKLHVTRVGSQLRRSTRLMGSDDDVLLQLATEPSLAAMSYAADNANEVDSEESESVSEIESDVEKKKAAPQASAQTASTKEVSYEDGDEDSPIDSEAEKKIAGSEGTPDTKQKKAGISHGSGQNDSVRGRTKEKARWVKKVKGGDESNSEEDEDSKGGDIEEDMVTQDNLIVSIFSRRVAKLTYKLKGEYFTFKKSDFTLLISLSTAYPPKEYFEMDELDPSEFCQKYFPCLEKMQNTFKGAVKLQEILAARKEAKANPSLLEDIYRLNRLYVLGAFLISVGHKGVSVIHIDLASDVEKFDQFPWEWVAFDTFKQSADELCDKMEDHFREKPNELFTACLHGCAMAFTLWIYQHLPKLGPRRVDDNNFPWFLVWSNFPRKNTRRNTWESKLVNKKLFLRNVLTVPEDVKARPAVRAALEDSGEEDFETGDSGDDVVEKQPAPKRARGVLKQEKKPVIAEASSKKNACTVKVVPPSKKKAKAVKGVPPPPSKKKTEAVKIVAPTEKKAVALKVVPPSKKSASKKKAEGVKIVPLREESISYEADISWGQTQMLHVVLDNTIPSLDHAGVVGGTINGRTLDENDVEAQQSVMDTLEDINTTLVETLRSPCKVVDLQSKSSSYDNTDILNGSQPNPEEGVGLDLIPQLSDSENLDCYLNRNQPELERRAGDHLTKGISNAHIRNDFLQKNQSEQARAEKGEVVKDMDINDHNALNSLNDGDTVKTIDENGKETSTLEKELLVESVTLEKERARSLLKELEAIDQTVNLIAHIWDWTAKLEQYSATNGVPIPPYFRCPPLLGLMLDPVIVASGQTYERAFIQRWVDNGLTFLKKTRQDLAHANLITNYTVKDLIANWCEDNNIRHCDTANGNNASPLPISSNVPSQDFTRAESFRCCFYSNNSTPRSSLEAGHRSQKKKVGD